MYSSPCPQCGALHPEGGSCEEDFHTLLGWETQYEGYGVIHHLTVLCYHLQHPSLYSPEGLAYAKGLLVDFLEHGKTTGQVRQESRGQVNSSHRSWKIKGKPGSQGSYAHPLRWTMTAADVANDDHTHYIENVQRWGKKVLEDLKESGNL